MSAMSDQEIEQLGRDERTSRPGETP